MAFCPNCGNKITPGFSFCPNCGFKLSSINTETTVSGVSTPADAVEKGDFIDRFIQYEFASTFEQFFEHVSIKGDIITICSALESEIMPAVRLGNASAQVVLGLLNEKGFGVEKSLDKAISCIMSAAEKGNPFAEWIAGLIIMKEESDILYFDVMDCDLKRFKPLSAFQYFTRSANQGWQASMVCLGNCYSSGDGVAQNKTEAMKWYRKAADLGFAPAQHKLGRCYDVSRDYPEALKWYSKAAAQGYAPSQNNIGVCFMRGKGVPVDYFEGSKWYRKAADQGLDIAQYNLGNCYENGRGVEIDNSQAEEWYKKAAEQGDAEYQLNLARWLRYHPVYVDGVRCYGNYTSWYEKAAKQGNAQAQYELAGKLMSDTLLGSEQVAAEWYQRAAAQGHSGAQFELGICYAKGKGVKKDLVAAKQWIQAAADQGNKAAIEYLNT